MWRVALISDIKGTDQVVAAIRVGFWGNTTMQWDKKKQDCRLVREKALEAPVAFRRLRDSVEMDITLRGQSCRAFLVSGILNLQAGRLSTAISRFFSAIPLAGHYFVYPDFWRGLTMRITNDSWLDMAIPQLAGGNWIRLRQRLKEPDNAG